MNRHLVTVGVLIAFALATASNTSADRISDPPRLVPWHMIGNVGIGMSRDRVEYMYGAPGPYGGYVTADGHQLVVSYDRRGRRVSSIWTDSPRYHYRSFGVDRTRIPLGSCHRAHGACEYRWNGGGVLNGFVYRRGSHGWVKRVRQHGLAVTVELVVKNGGTLAQVVMSHFNPRDDDGD